MFGCREVMPNLDENEMEIGALNRADTISLLLEPKRELGCVSIRWISMADPWETGQRLRTAVFARPSISAQLVRLSETGPLHG